MKRIISIVMITILVFTNTVVFAKDAVDKTNDRKNIAPEVDFSITSKKTVDIVVVTDYAGAKLADLQNRLSDMKAAGLVNGADIKYTLIGSNTQIGTQQSSIPVQCYGRAIYFSYTQQNISGYEAPATLSKTDRINYEYCELEPGQLLPPLVKGDQVYYDNQYTEYQGMGWCYIGRKIVFYNPYNYSATKTGHILTEQWSNGWDSGPSGYYYRSYSNFSMNATNYWSWASTYQRSVTSNISAFDYSKLNSSVFRAGSSRYVLLLTDNTNTVSYNQNFGNYYPFANMRSDNIGAFINENDAHAYAICNSSITDIKLSDSAYGVTYSNSNMKQNQSIRDVVNSSKDGRIYSSGQLQNALDQISGNTGKPENNNIDLMVATDQDAAVPNAFINKLKSRLNSSVDLKVTVIDNSVNMQVDTLQKPEFKNIKKNTSFNTAYGKSYLLLDEGGNLFAMGYNYAYSYYYASWSCQKKLGIFGNSTVDKYDSFTKILSDVKDFEIVTYSISNYSWNMLLVIKNDGTMVGCGENFSGILEKWNIRSTDGMLLNDTITSFVPIRTLSNIKKIKALVPLTSSGNYYYNLRNISTILISLTNDGSFYYLGSDQNYCLHYDPSYSTPTFNEPYHDISLNNIVDFAAYNDSYNYITLLAGMTVGGIYVKGRDYYFNPLNTSNWYQRSNTNFMYCCAAAGSVKSIYLPASASPNKLFFTLDNGDLYVFSTQADYTNGIGTVIPNPPRKVMSNVKSLYISQYSFAYAITTNGDIYYWGYTQYLHNSFLGYDPPSDYWITLPTKCTTINNVSEIYGNSIMNNNLIFYKKYDGTYYYAGDAYGYNIYDTDPNKLDNTTYTKTITPIKVNASPSLNISDFMYMNGTGLLALDMAGSITLGGITYTYNYSTGIYTYSYSSTSYGNNPELYNYIPIPIYGINTDAIASAPLREGSQRYFVYLSNSTSINTTNEYGSYYPFGSLDEDLINYLKDNNFNSYAICPYTALSLKLQTPYVSTNFQTKTLQDLLNSSSSGSGNYVTSDPIIEIISEKYSTAAAGTSREYYIISGEDLADYNMSYNDFEVDPKYAEQWQYTHDSTFYENSNGLLPTSGLWAAAPIVNFTHVGKYTVRCKVRDNPKDDDNFDKYRLWSNLSPAFTLYVHRRPVALFSVSLVKSGTSYKTQINNLSYDLDHVSRSDKGISQSYWQWRLLPNTDWTDGTLPGLIQANKQYQVKLIVQDIEGALSQPYIYTLDTAQVNLPPVVDADPQTYNGLAPLNVTVTANDNGENDFLRTDFAWTNNTSVPSTWTSKSARTFVTSPPGDGTWYLHMKAFDSYGHSYYVNRGPYTVYSLKITGVTIDGYWNHWRGQVDMFGRQLTNEPHRFLSYERVKLTVNTTGNPDRIEVTFSPELQSMSFTDIFGNVYNYADKIGYTVNFPHQITVTGNQSIWEYVLPLAKSTKDWNDTTLRSPYWMQVKAYKGAASDTYILPGGIDITGNVYDLTYIQPVQ